MQISCAHGVYHLIGAVVIFSPSTSEFTYQLHVALSVAIAAESLAATSDPRRTKKEPNWLCSVGRATYQLILEPNLPLMVHASINPCDTPRIYVRILILN